MANRLAVSSVLQRSSGTYHIGILQVLMGNQAMVESDGLIESSSDSIGEA